MALEVAGLPEGSGEDTAEAERIKAASAASDNYANFFGQNLFAAASGVALIAATLKMYGYEVAQADVSLWTIPAAATSVVFASVQYRLLDRWLRRRQAAQPAQPAPETSHAN
jgi:uncharacterized membrane protein